MIGVNARLKQMSSDLSAGSTRCGYLIEVFGVQMCPSRKRVTSCHICGRRCAAMVDAYIRFNQLAGVFSHSTCYKLLKRLAVLLGCYLMPIWSQLRSDRSSKQPNIIAKPLITAHSHILGLLEGLWISILHGIPNLLKMNIKNIGTEMFRKCTLVKVY